MREGDSLKKFCFVILALVATAGAIGNAQTLRVRLLDGRSGEPISNTYVNVWVGNQRKTALPIPIDSSGNAVLRLTGGAADEGVQAESVHWPTFPCAPEIKIQAGFVLCH